MHGGCAQNQIRKLAIAKVLLICVTSGRPKPLKVQAVFPKRMLVSMLLLIARPPPLQVFARRLPSQRIFKDGPALRQCSACACSGKAAAALKLLVVVDFYQYLKGLEVVGQLSEDVISSAVR